jgi:pyridoxine/pyridoxamine 5'-phosphate oxidase
VAANRIEFWEHGAHRLHDRVVHRIQDGNWVVDRLAP